MELILTKDVPSLGIANEVVKVKPGYARNYLLPRRLAIVATPASLKERAGKIAAAADRRRQQLSEAMELADRIGRISVSFERKSSDEGRLFGSVTKEDIVNQLKEMHMIEVDRKSISLDQPIKLTGETLVKIRLETGVSANLTVVVSAEKDPAAVAAETAVAEEAQEA